MHNRSYDASLDWQKKLRSRHSGSSQAATIHQCHTWCYTSVMLHFSNTGMLVYYTTISKLFTSVIVSASYKMDNILSQVHLSENSGYLVAHKYQPQNQNSFTPIIWKLAEHTSGLYILLYLYHYTNLWILYYTGKLLLTWHGYPCWCHFCHLAGL